MKLNLVILSIFASIAYSNFACEHSKTNKTQGSKKTTLAIALTSKNKETPKTAELDNAPQLKSRKLADSDKKKASENLTRSINSLVSKEMPQPTKTLVHKSSSTDSDLDQNFGQTELEEESGIDLDDVDLS